MENNYTAENIKRMVKTKIVSKLSTKLTQNQFLQNKFRKKSRTTNQQTLHKQAY